MAAVAGGNLSEPVLATLDGYAVHPVRDNVVPFIIIAPGAECAGVLWRGLTAEQTRRLDTYEGAFGYTLEDVNLQVGARTVAARCYMPPAGIFAGVGDWSLAAWEVEHLVPAVLAARELFAHDPLPDAESLRRMWPMIEARAWSKNRAAAGPTTVRYQPVAGDVAVVAERPPQGAFFRLQGVHVSHRRFDGSKAENLPREAFLGVDAAIVLPYDPTHDRVVLVEQFRMGPMMRHDPNPWMLEPVAGIVDARETPRKTAFRETQEEAGLHLRHLEPVSAFYTSPGSSTDFMYTYIGLCDIPQTAPYAGGLADESEDLRLHPMTLDDALALADTGEIATGPLLLLLNWLARNKDRLRAKS